MGVTNHCTDKIARAQNDDVGQGAYLVECGEKLVCSLERCSLVHEASMVLSLYVPAVHHCTLHHQSPSAAIPQWSRPHQ